MVKIFRIHLHRSASCYSSRDKMLYKYVNSEEEIIYLGREFHGYDYQLNADPTKDKFIRIYNAEVKCSIYREFSVETFDKLIKICRANGFYEEIPSEIFRYNERQEKKKIEYNIKHGFLYQKNYKKMKAADFKGEFSKTVLGTKAFKAILLSAPYIFGYVGHSARQFRLDEVIEREFFKLKPPLKYTKKQMSELLATWLGSTDARYFMDNLEGESFRAQIKSIKKYAASMYNHGLIYMHPNHDGSFSATQGIAKLIKDELIEEKE